MDVQPHIKLADSSAIPSLSEVPVTACLTTLPKSSILTALSGAQRDVNKLFFFFLHNALVYRWKACTPLCYSTQYKCFIESEILASLYLSAGGRSTQPSLCANQHCNFTIQGTPAVFLHKYVSIISFLCQLHDMGTLYIADMSFQGL